MEAQRKCPDCGKLHNCGFRDLSNKIVEPLVKCFGCTVQDKLAQLNKKSSYEFTKYWKEPND